MNRLKIIMTLVFSIFLAVPAATTAATLEFGATVVLEVIDGESGGSVTEGCFVLEEAGDEGCDDDRDGYISFEAVAPGRYQVIQTQGIEGFLPIGAFPINVNAETLEQTFRIETFTGAASGDPVDMVVEAVDSATGEPITDACFEFRGGSLEGCDENGDGRITFDDMKVGSYLLENTQDAAGYEFAEARWVPVTTGETVQVEITPEGSEEGGDSEIPDIALITRELDSADLLYRSCFVLIDYSNEGCDENNDGLVTFEDVPAGAYEVEQTAAPVDYDPTGNFTIEVVDDAPEQGIVVKQAETQTDGDHRHVSVLFQDHYTGELIASPDTCVELVNADYASAEGCDDNTDGQVDFLDVPLGSYELRLVNLPRGSELVQGRFMIDVEATDASAILVVVTLRFV